MQLDIWFKIQKRFQLTVFTKRMIIIILLLFFKLTNDIILWDSRLGCSDFQIF